VGRLRSRDGLEVMLPRNRTVVVYGNPMDGRKLRGLGGEFTEGLYMSRIIPHINTRVMRISTAIQGVEVKHSVSSYSSRIWFSFVWPPTQPGSHRKTQNRKDHRCRIQIVSDEIAPVEFSLIYVDRSSILGWHCINSTDFGLRGPRHHCSIVKSYIELAET
jgi:hypothetical protein